MRTPPLEDEQFTQVSVLITVKSGREKDGWYAEMVVPVGRSFYTAHIRSRPTREAAVEAVANIYRMHLRDGGHPQTPPEESSDT